MNIQPKVFLIDDDEAVRDGLSLYLQTVGIAVEAYDCAEAFLEAYSPGKPGCVLLDVNMPGMSGPDLQDELTRRDIQLPIIFLTAFGDIPMTVRAIKAGAVDFLAKPVQGKELLERLRAAFLIDEQARGEIEAHRTHCAALDGLTPRELDVLQFVVAGQSNKEIARHLGISHRTVEVHRSRIMEKTGAANLIELASLYHVCKIPPDRTSS